jgi:hypothetical protein
MLAGGWACPLGRQAEENNGREPSFSLSMGIWRSSANALRYFEVGAEFSAFAEMSYTSLLPWKT